MVLLVWILALVILFLLLIPRTASETKDDSKGLFDYCLSVEDSPAMPTYLIPRLSDDSLIRERQKFVIKQCDRFGVDPLLALAIISCEGGLYNEENCNKQYGCSSGQGPYQFIESTWYSTIARMTCTGRYANKEDTPEEKKCIPVNIPDKCKIGDTRGDFECNIIAGTWLLAKDGIGHWSPYSGHCFLAKYNN